MNEQRIKRINNESTKIKTMKQFSKYTGMILLVSCICLLAGACKEEEETFPTFPAPVWDVNPAMYSVNMTAVVKLPSNLEEYAQADDRLAAFVGGECRGVGEVVETSGRKLYFVTIHGTADDESTVSFQYYSARNRYLYRTDELFAYEADKMFGTVDEPEILTFSIVK
jgi:hypothetical protein